MSDRVVRVTAIISTYNYSEVLPYSVGSVLRQTFDDWELFVVGDACTDDSAEVVGRFDDPRVNWINLPERVGTASGPLNEGLRRASGDVIAYLGHDDLWLPRHLELLVARLDGGSMAAAAILAVAREDGLKISPPERGKCPSRFGHRRELIDRVGNWGLPHEVTREYDADFGRRIRQAGIDVDPIWEITAVKIPAIRRPGIYDERPSDLQAQWFEATASGPPLVLLDELHRHMREQPDVSAAHAAAMARHAARTAALRLRRAIPRRSRGERSDDDFAKRPWFDPTEHDEDDTASKNAAYRDNLERRLDWKGAGRD